MPETPNDQENLSPYKLLDNFSKNRVASCILLALIIHVAIIGGLSTGYIYDTWIDPSARSENGDNEEQGTGSPSGEESAGEKSGNAPDTAASSDPESGGKSENGSKQPGDPPQDAPVVGRVTDKPEPGEIPKEPSGLGIPLDGLRD